MYILGLHDLAPRNSLKLGFRWLRNGPNHIVHLTGLFCLNGSANYYRWVRSSVPVRIESSLLYIVHLSLHWTVDLLINYASMPTGQVGLYYEPKLDSSFNNSNRVAARLMSRMNAK